MIGACNANNLQLSLNHSKSKFRQGVVPRVEMIVRIKN